MFARTIRFAQSPRSSSTGVVLCCVASLTSAVGCSADPEPGLADCVPMSEALALPHPGWQAGDEFAPPAGDRAVELLRALRPTWIEALAEIAGWPRYPIIVVPLDHAAAAVEAAQIQIFQGTGEVLEQVNLGFEATLEDGGLTLILRPERPFDAAGQDVVVLVPDAALTGARALPVCNRAGEPHAAYGQARAELPSGTPDGLALPFHLATTPSELGQLYQALESNPVLQVDSAEPRQLDSFGEHSPPAEVAALLGPTASGILSLPAYQDDDGVMVVDAESLPQAQGTTRPGLIVVLPAAGSPPYPFVLYQHGGSQQKENILPIMGPLAEAGFAVVAIDLPYHGDRAVPGASDLDILDFDHPLKTRDNLRQAAADHLAVLTGITELNEAFGDALGIDGALDPSQAHYLGLSLGGLTGSYTFASATQLRAAALFVAGGGYPEILETGMFSVFTTDINSYEGGEQAVLMGMIETLLDGADPIAYPPFEARELDPRPAVFFEAIGDPVIGSQATDQWARAFGAALATPYDHEVDRMATVPLPTSDNFSWPTGSEAATRVLIQAPMTGVEVGEIHAGLIGMPYSQQLVAHCFSTLGSEGSCEVVDTGFAD